MLLCPMTPGYTNATVAGLITFEKNVTVFYPMFYHAGQFRTQHDELLS